MTNVPTADNRSGENLRAGMAELGLRWRCEEMSAADSVRVRTVSRLCWPPFTAQLAKAPRFLRRTGLHPQKGEE